MRIISIKKLKLFWIKHKDSEQSLRAWYAEVKKINWSNPEDIKERYKSASFLQHNRVVFNIKGNKYRLIVSVRYDFKIVYIRFIGTHEDYNKINAMEV